MCREPRWVIPILIATAIAFNVLYAASDGRRRTLPATSGPIKSVIAATPVGREV